MRRKKIKECWYKNLTHSDLIISDLGLKILANRTVNLYKLNPRLNPQRIAESEEEGALSVCNEMRKVLKLPKAPLIVEDELPSFIKEASTSLPSRVKSVPVLDKKEDYFEELTGGITEENAYLYEYMDEGLADPMLESVAMSSDDDSPAVVVNPNLGAPTDQPIQPNSQAVGAEAQTVGRGDSRYITVRTLD